MPATTTTRPADESSQPAHVQPAGAGGLQLVATPCYDAPGCDGPSYCSILVVAAGSQATSPADLQGKRAAFNTPDSQSGMNALRAVIAPLAEGGRFFAEIIETGGHAASLDLVAAGGAR